MRNKIYNGLKLILILVITVCFTPSQKENPDANESVQIEKYLDKKDGDWLYFKSGLKIPIVEFFSKNKVTLGFQDDFGIQIENEDSDDLGMVHYLLRLTNKNVVIDDAWYTAHYSKDGDLLIFEGKYIGEILKKNKMISETDAIMIAKNAFTTSEIIPLDYFQLIKEDISNATKENERVNCKLVYYKQKDHNYLLVYKVVLTSTISVPMHQFYIDANNGEILKNDVLVFKSSNTAVTKYNGERTIQTTYSDYRYYLTNTSKPTPIETRNSTFQIGWDYCIPYNFTNLNSIYHNSPYWPYDIYNNAASAHWAVQESYNVFYNHFSRIYGTFTSSGGSLRVENNYFKRRDYPDGSNDNLSTFYQPGGNSYDYIHAGNIYGSEGYDVGLDVIGHEFTHGCLYRSRSIDKITGTEAGALLESLCDIFGEVIEYYTLGDNDYIFGTNDKPRYRRDFINPESDSVFYSPELTESCSPTIDSETFLCFAPATWQGTNWYDTSDPNSSYINCSVQNRWFYLLAEGGTQNGVTVTGIGIEKAAYITYRNLAYYFNNTYTFASMRNASISNAQSYYGTCSNECHQVMNAWAAVGVGAQAPAPCISVAIGGPLQRYYGESGTWTAYANGGSGYYSYTWYVDGFPASYQSSLIFDFYPDELTVYTIGVSVTDGNLSDYCEIYVSVSPEEGMKSLENSQLKIEVFPNPATDKATLQIIDDENSPIITIDENILIYLIDKNGRVLLNMKTKNRKIDINLTNIQKGTYTIVSLIGKYKMSYELVINH